MVSPAVPYSSEIKMQSFHSKQQYKASKDWWHLHNDDCKCGYSHNRLDVPQCGLELGPGGDLCALFGGQATGQFFVKAARLAGACKIGQANAEADYAQQQECYPPPLPAKSGARPCICRRE